jgi:hypothetical protein
VTYDEAAEKLAPLLGEQIRIVYPNGATKIGRLGMWRDLCFKLDDRTLMGELAGCIKIEVKQSNGRYA